MKYIFSQCVKGELISKKQALKIANDANKGLLEKDIKVIMIERDGYENELWFRDQLFDSYKFIKNRIVELLKNPNDRIAVLNQFLI